MFCDVRIEFYENAVNVKAIIDTGNLLKEPITGKSVVVIEKEELIEIFPRYILENLENIMGGDVEKIYTEDEIDKYISKFKVIPFSSLGKQNGMLLGFKPDNIKIGLDENEEIDVEGIVGIYDKQLSKIGMYHGLVGLDILEDRRVIKSEYSRDVKV